MFFEEKIIYTIVYSSIHSQSNYVSIGSITKVSNFPQPIFSSNSSNNKKGVSTTSNWWSNSRLKLGWKIIDQKLEKIYFLLSTTSSFAKKKKPVDFDDELKIGDVRYDNMTKITIKQQLFWRLPYEM